MHIFFHQSTLHPYTGSPNAGEAERGEAERLGEGCRRGLDGGGPSKRPGSEKRKSDRSSLEKNTRRWSRHQFYVTATLYNMKMLHKNVVLFEVSYRFIRFHK